MKNRQLFVAVGLFSLALTACSGVDTDGPVSVGSSSSTVPVSVSRTPVTVPASEMPSASSLHSTVVDAPESETPPPPAYVPPEARACVDISSPVVSEAVQSLEPFSGRSWRATSAGAPCSTLVSVTADIEGATGSSPTNVLFFAGGEYLGTATAKPTAFTQVVGGNDYTVEVQYKWLEPGDVTADPTGGPVIVRYLWDGSSVQMLDQLPVQVTG
ncbi:LppP/LprE lipoprotein [Rhodococcus sp. OK302]|nr:LppP/LprE lipoprotein [Rhodococcus sp. OK302]